MEKINLIKLISGIVFLIALMLNIQTSLNGDFSLIPITLAQSTGGSGGSGPNYEEVPCRVMQGWTCIVGDCYVVIRCNDCVQALADQPYDYGFTCQKCTCP
ncbi:hypothetical protein KZP23_17230 [Echinicola marina]|uniref:hypothetical protein n=1 Tax=Echinicola marina TaxID=2859768 RepID=UPI001CF64208|nr:hypothetical protein [Echinicola marina]UCS92425.1 hypothetical protein KZP23_17230 [Echinicola marina]